ncbi:amino acid ABC transporter substrate-binding protein (PAAT family) [Propionicimonas paludicola]|uniref:Amino acid ABC transporter substrate-binding protein (PAAT family) n=1 Tax=Propionicimonas paludicola TaxID=185243 RepID=A0A2A9CQB3_9ACTN|nr:ABC transporter substrate-binding protein [Propionicimonas paludicola]PFG15850.1 amino acid ABC transporter substrate-binding protein (PAAT family) [Propionicimonas paludicola]
MTRYLNRVVAVAASAAFALGLAACSTGAATPASPGSPAASESTSASATPTTVDVKTLTVTPGKLTIATGKPAYSPWVEDDKPESGKGFEAAVAYAVAEKLGFAKEDVVWKRTTFDAAIAPGPKAWDFNLQQYSITDKRKKAVDFSSPYYTTTQAVLTYAGSPAESATSIAALKSVVLGVAAGTTSQSALTTLIAPTATPKVFNTNEDLVQALKTKQVQAIVVDLPTALYLSAAVLDNGKIVGQLADNTGGDQYGLVLPKGSKLTAAVTAAVDALSADGTLKGLEKTWLSESIKVPVLS